jgi:hypothetical protein
LTPARGAGEIIGQRDKLKFVTDCLAERARAHAKLAEADAERVRSRVRERSDDLLDEWCRIVTEYGKANVSLSYNQSEAGGTQPLLRTFLDPELKLLPSRHRKFRANRSMRDVEPSVNLWLKTMDGIDLEEDEEA